MADIQDTPPAAPRKRPPPRPVTVKSVAPVTPRTVRVVFRGDALDGFGPAKPSAHIKILFDNPPFAWTPASEGARPPSRTYTPLAFDAEARELTVDFALHGDGLASNWVQTAKPGDAVWIGGPGGGFDPAPDLTRIVMICDDTALPAAEMIVNALPAGCEVVLVAEVVDAAEERALGKLPAADARWVHRLNGDSGPGLEAALATIEGGAETFWWIACEAGAMRTMRKHLMAERKVPGGRMVTRGYWQAGASNHPDHDYGED